MSDYLKTPTPGAPSQGPPPLPAQQMSQSSGLATAALILGLASILLMGPFTGIPALICGFLALSKIKKSGGQLTGVGKAWTGIIIGGLFLLLTMVYFVFVPKGTKAPRTAFRQAISEVRSDRDGSAHGNTEEAKEIAKKISEAFSEMMEDEPESGLTKRDLFDVYCQQNEDSVAVIVRVPKLKDFDKESKTTFAENTWNLATYCLEGSSQKAGSELAIGVRGRLIFSDIYFGTFERGVEKPEQLISSKTQDQKKLEGYFPEPEIASAPVETSTTQ